MGKFKQIGVGYQAKNGKNYISIRLNYDIVKNMPSFDFEKIYMFENKYKKSNIDPDFVIHAPVVQTNTLQQKLIKE